MLFPFPLTFPFSINNKEKPLFLPNLKTSYNSLWFLILVPFFRNLTLFTFFYHSSIPICISCEKAENFPFSFCVLFFAINSSYHFSSPPVFFYPSLSEVWVKYKQKSLISMRKLSSLAEFARKLCRVRISRWGLMGKITGEREWEGKDNEKTFLILKMILKMRQNENVYRGKTLSWINLGKIFCFSKIQFMNKLIVHRYSTRSLTIATVNGFCSHPIAHTSQNVAHFHRSTSMPLPLRNPHPPHISIEAKKIDGVYWIANPFTFYIFILRITNSHLKKGLKFLKF